MEIERKFLLSRLPDLTPEARAVVHQGYLSLEPEIRVRRYVPEEGEPVYTLTVKGEGTLSREEIETEISEEFFRKAERLIGKPLVRKDYSRYRFEGHILECSLVDGSFLYGEVEFGTEKEALSYVWPFEGAVEITYEKDYKMKNYWRRTRGEEA